MKKQIFGAILLSAALAAGTAMPAFAATSTDTLNKEGDLGSDSSYTISDVAGQGGETTVNISTLITQINVAVPLEVGFYAETGGGTLGVPSDGVYKLKNASAADVYIVQIDATAVNKANWVLSDLDSTFDTTSTAGTAVKYGNLAVMMKPADATVTTDPLNFANKAVTVKDSDGGMKIGKKVGTTDGEFGFNFEGKNGILNNHNGTAEIMSKITYTVALNPGYKGL